MCCNFVDGEDNQVGKSRLFKLSFLPTASSTMTVKHKSITSGLENYQSSLSVLCCHFTDPTFMSLTLTRVPETRPMT